MCPLVTAQPLEEHALFFNCIMGRNYKGVRLPSWPRQSIPFPWWICHHVCLPKPQEPACATQGRALEPLTTPNQSRGPPTLCLRPDNNMVNPGVTTTHHEPSVIQQVLCQGPPVHVHLQHVRYQVLGSLCDHVPLTPLKAVHTWMAKGTNGRLSVSQSVVHAHCIKTWLCFSVSSLCQHM